MYPFPSSNAPLLNKRTTSGSPGPPTNAGGLAAPGPVRAGSPNALPTPGGPSSPNSASGNAPVTVSSQQLQPSPQAMHGASDSASFVASVSSAHSSVLVPHDAPTGDIINTVIYPRPPTLDPLYNPAYPHEATVDLSHKPDVFLCAEPSEDKDDFSMVIFLMLTALGVRVFYPEHACITSVSGVSDRDAPHEPASTASLNTDAKTREKDLVTSINDRLVSRALHSCRSTIVVVTDKLLTTPARRKELGTLFARSRGAKGGMAFDAPSAGSAAASGTPSSTPQVSPAALPAPSDAPLQFLPIFQKLSPNDCRKAKYGSVGLAIAELPDPGVRKHDLATMRAFLLEHVLPYLLQKIPPLAPPFRPLAFSPSPPPSASMDGARLLGPRDIVALHAAVGHIISQAKALAKQGIASRAAASSSPPHATPLSGSAGPSFHFHTFKDALKIIVPNLLENAEVSSNAPLAASFSAALPFREPVTRPTSGVGSPRERNQDDPVKSFVETALKSRVVTPFLFAVVQRPLDESWPPSAAEAVGVASVTLPLSLPLPPTVARLGLQKGDRQADGPVASVQPVQSGAAGSLVHSSSVSPVSASRNSSVSTAAAASGKERTGSRDWKDVPLDFETGRERADAAAGSSAISPPRGSTFQHSGIRSLEFT